MIRVSTSDPVFANARANATRALPAERLETPRQYGQRWREEFRCRIDPSSRFDNLYYIFDRDEDYTWFILQWT